MPSSFIADAVICARNAAPTLAGVLERLPRRSLRSVVVVDRDSDDGTAEIARDAGCLVLRESTIGYGSACQAAIAHLESLPRAPDAVAFVAADGTEPAVEIDALLDPIRDGGAELVIGTSLDGSSVSTDSPLAELGDRVALGLIGVLYRHRFSAMSSFRAVRFPALVALAVGDRGSGWDAEMQVKAVKLGLQIAEVAVGSGQSGTKRRVGGSKHRAKTVASARRNARMLFRILRHSTTR